MFKSGVGNRSLRLRVTFPKIVSKAGAVFLLVALLAAGLPVRPAYAAACTWTGNTSTDWADALNWSGCGGVVPQATDTVVITDATNDPVLGGDVTIAGLTINTGGVLSIGANILTLTGGISNSGRLNGDTGTLILAFTTNRSLSGAGLYDLNNLIVNSTGVYVNLSSDVTLHVGGDFTKLAGSFRCNSANNATSNTCTLDFDGGGSSLFSWTTSSILPWNITVQSGTTVNIGATNNSFTLRGDLGGDGTLTASAGTITFETVTTANLAGTKTLNNIVVNSPTTLLLAVDANLAYKGTFTLNGTFDAITNSPTTLMIAGTSTQTLPSGATLHNLTINNANGVILSANTAVNGTLTFINGRIITGANALIVGGAVSGAGADRYVYGNLQKPVTTGSPIVTFEVGGDSNYAPINVTFTGLSGDGTLTGSTTDNLSAHPGYGSIGFTTDYINRYWTLTPGGLAFTSYDATFNFVAGDYVGSPTPGSMVVQKYNGSWSQAASNTATATSATGVGFTSFSDFAVGNKGSVTPVTLSYFAAQRVGSDVEIEWSTATEIGNLGFNLYALEAGELRRLNANLVPSQNADSLEQQDYSFRAETSGTIFYLEEVDLQGDADRHGPYALAEIYGARGDENRIDWTAIRDDYDLAQETLQPTLRSDLSAGPIKSASFTLKVRQTGLYRVTYEMLKNAGLDLVGVPLWKVALTNRGQNVPIYVKGARRFGPGAYIEFYGQALDTPYTDTNVYTLQVGQIPTGRILANEAMPHRTARPAASYGETLVVNNQKVYAVFAPGKDAWYDTGMLVRAESKTWSFPFQVDSLDSSAPAALEVVVWGMTDWSKGDDHHLRVSLNDVPLSDQVFDGRVERTLKLDLPAGLLVEGTNTLQLTLPGDTGVQAEQVTLDKFSVNYQRAFRAKDGRLTFTAMGRVFQVTNLPGRNVVVYRLERNHLVKLGQVQVRKSGDTFFAVFAGTNKPATYFVSTVESLYSPTFEAAKQAVDLNRPAQYLVIAHPNFIAGLQPLVQARQAQGLTVSVVDVTDLYAQYSYGIFDPTAIQKYIAYAAQNLGTEYVLLVGGDTYDYRNYLGINSLSFIPSLYVRIGPMAGLIPADPLFADVDQDNVPDVAIGRFPVRTTAELDMLVNKTLAYASKDYGRTFVFASDRNDRRTSFKAISAGFALSLPDDWVVENIHLADVNVTAARTQLLEAMNRGTALVTFTGHSSPRKWSSSNLFDFQDAASLTNAGKPFVVVQWGCFNSYHVNPMYNNLTQGFLLSGDRGAAAMLGATTLASSTSEQLLGNLLTPRLTQPGMTLGQAVQMSKRELAQTHPDLLDVLLGWSLMGDPALVIEP